MDHGGGPGDPLEDHGHMMHQPQMLMQDQHQEMHHEDMLMQPPPPPAPLWQGDILPQSHMHEHPLPAVDPQAHQLSIIRSFIAGKSLESVNVKDVRREIELKTGVRPSKEETTTMIRKILADDEAEASDDDDNDSPDSKRIFTLSRELAAIVGFAEGSQKEIVRKIWSYIKSNNLQNPENSGELICDDRLLKIFDRSIVHLFNLKTYLKHHMSLRDPLPHESTEPGLDEVDLLDPDARESHAATAIALKKRSEARKTATKGAQTKAKKAKSSSVAQGGFGKETLVMSPVLREFLGEDNLTRPQIVKALWAYIKLHNLQKPSNRKNIACDDALKRLFHRDEVTMFNLNRFLTVHIKSRKNWEAGDQTFDYAKLDMDDSEWAALANSKPESTTKKRRRERKATANLPKKRGGFTKILPLSQELAEFMGQSSATRGDVVKKLWAHIRANNLKNENNRQEILCDDVLKSLLGQETVTQFSINKYIQPHFLKDQE
mmetsp:Transcript_16975/g.31237  ORF Transcript_16975/g.31237 Transcript_16975/m.31237 type:complete len:490 (+) Transcript_16975:111-1580(+)